MACGGCRDLNRLIAHLIEEVDQPTITARRQPVLFLAAADAQAAALDPGSRLPDRSLRSSRYTA
jgi:hypothetical protein